MKVTRHEGVPRPTSLTLQTVPLIVWLSKTVELSIDKGDTLGDVATHIRVAWKVPRKEACRIAAFWFAIGERQHYKKHAGDFTKRELLAREDRRYLVK